MEENEIFDPQDFDVLPNDIREIDCCIEYANKCLQTATSRSLPKWPTQVSDSSPSDLSYFPQLSVDVPKGSFFYPCSGNDFNLPIEVFSNYANEFHFADAFSRDYGKNKSLRPEVITTDIPWIGKIALGGYSQSKKEIDDAQVIFHRKDGLITLLEDIVDLTIFFYRGDSSGEGGSGQLWQGPVLLDYVLMRIQSGGLLCTDDSNGFGSLFNELRSMHQVDYRNVCLRRLDTKNLRTLNNLKIWQVTKNENSN
jgi:hypothetical protein